MSFRSWIQFHKSAIQLGSRGNRRRRKAERRLASARLASGFGLEQLECRDLLALVPLTVTVTGVGHNSGAGVDFHAAVTINGVTQNTPTQNGSSIFVNWPITLNVDSAAPSTVAIDLFGDGSQIDIDPGADQSINLTVDPITCVWSGDLKWPSSLSQVVGGGGGNGNLSFAMSIPGTTTDSDGDGLPDSWETNGLDLDGNRGNGVDLPLNTWGAKADHKDLFLEFDWMSGAIPQREEISALKAAFAVAPIDAGNNASALPGGTDAHNNPDGLPGITLHVDTGGLTDGSGQLVGDNLGGGNQVSTLNVSNLNSNFYLLKNGNAGTPGNFNSARQFAFRYAISSTLPTNFSGTSTGGNASTTLIDTSQSWVTNEWAGYNVSITAGTGAGQKLPIASNTATMLTLKSGSTWSTTPDNTSKFSIDWKSGGWGEIGGNDFMEFNHDAGTIMHEFGHTLNLHHGGPEDTNRKPNYISVMNYDHQFGIPQNSGATIIDYAPAKISFGGSTSGGNTATTFNDTAQSWTPNQWVGGYVEVVVGTARETRKVVSNTATQLVVAQAWSSVPGGGVPYALYTANQPRAVAPLGGLTENSLAETAVLDATDTANRIVFSDANYGTTKVKVQYPANGRNRDGVGPVDGPDYDGDKTVDGSPVAVNLNADYDSTTDATPYTGQDDWRRISLPFRQFGDSATGAIRVEDTAPPTLTELLQAIAEQNTSDVSVAVSAAPDPVDQGSHLVYTYTVSVNGSNPADQVAVVDTLPFGVDFVSANTSQGSAAWDGTTVKWTLGAVYPGVPVTLHLDVIPQLVGVMTNTATASTIDIDPNASNNSGPKAVTVLNVPPQISSLSLSATSINENDDLDLTVKFTDPGRLDTHTVDIAWGDGTTDTAVPIAFPAREFTIRHRYLDDNPSGTALDVNAIHVTVHDNNDGSGSGDTSVKVSNLLPVIAGAGAGSTSATPGKEGVPTTVSATFTDVGTLDTHTALVDWNDGSITPAVISETGGVGSLSATHTYAAGGIYTVKITLTDDDTGLATTTQTLFITGVGVHVLPDGRTALEVIGSADGDSVTVNQQGNGLFKVHASFLAENFRTVPVAGIQVLEIVMLGGNDQVTVAGSVDLPAVIDGGDGDDQLNGGNAGSILIGGRGNDKLLGGNVRDILIGGTDTDRLNGNSGDDILIAGRTSYDSGADGDKLANDLALLKILAEWNTTRSYAERVANVLDGTGPILGGTGLKLKRGVTVFDDVAADDLTGAAGTDWYFFSPPGSATDNKPEERIN